MRTFYIRTLGCKTNQYESRGIAESLTLAGLAEVPTAKEADLCLLNTCGVTARSDASCRSAARQIRRANPKATLVITGCCVDLAQDWPDALKPDLLVGNRFKHRIASLVDEMPASAAPQVPDAAGTGEAFGLSVSSFSRSTRAFIKIQDGCSNRCSYCAIPDARGKPVSRPLAAILSEAARLIEHGHRELVITGINIGQYCSDQGAPLARVVTALGGLAGLDRLRLGSIEPAHVTDDLLSAMAGATTVCPHLHIPLQSGDNGVLQAMNRGYSAEQFAETVKRVRRYLDTPAITTDVIVGFPGEDQKAFQNSMAVCRSIGFSRMHVFLFSPRPGTPAADMPRNIPDRTVTSNRDALIALADEMAGVFAQELVGKRVGVILEERGESGWEGYADRYVRLCLPDAPDAPKGRFTVVPDRAEGKVLHADWSRAHPPANALR